MAVRIDNRWWSLIISLSVIGYVIQPILADNANDGHSVFAEASEDEKPIPRPREIFSTAKIESSGDSLLPQSASPSDASHQAIDDTSMPASKVVPTEPIASWLMNKPVPSTAQASVMMNTNEYKIENGGLYQERIIGGDIARPGDWPWMAILYLAGQQWCGGTLIGEKHVLTATHCVYNVSNPSDMMVRLGDYNIATDNEVRHIERRVNRIVLAPGYGNNPVRNDIAILMLDAPVQFTQAIRPIRLPSGSQLYTGKMGTIIGWGCTEMEGRPEAVLRRVSMPIISDAECEYPVADTVICVASPGKSVCEGDSGGPLMVNEGGQWIQVGVASVRNNYPNHPSAFTRITKYMSWIRQNLK